jgi:hypothetical protein
LKLVGIDIQTETARAPLPTLRGGDGQASAPAGGVPPDLIDCTPLIGMFFFCCLFFRVLLLLLSFTF